MSTNPFSIKGLSRLRQHGRGASASAVIAPRTAYAQVPCDHALGRIEGGKTAENSRHNAPAGAETTTECIFRWRSAGGNGTPQDYRNRDTCIPSGTGPSTLGW